MKPICGVVPLYTQKHVASSRIQWMKQWIYSIFERKRLFQSETEAKKDRNQLED